MEIYNYDDCEGVNFGVMKHWWQLKKLDRMMLTGFFPPFVLATFIALFVLIMQTLWLYIDDILGKGASLFVVVEFLAYLSMSLVPLALPIGILLASVMLFGGLGERYELSSMKSAGISLFRIMLPMIFLSAGISLFSFLSNEYIIPLSNLKFKSRLYDLRKSRPTLNLEENAFNEDFNGYIIHIGRKGEEGRRIEDVLIYDHQNVDSKGKVNIIKAKEGEMYASEDNNFFIMKLRQGNMYQEMDGNKGEGRYPFLQSSFGTWTKIFDLRQFDMNRTDEDLFKSNQSMKNSRQLQQDIDSMYVKLRELEEETFALTGALLEEAYGVQKNIETNTSDTSTEDNDSLTASQQDEELEVLKLRRERADALRSQLKRDGGKTDFSQSRTASHTLDSIDQLYLSFDEAQQAAIINMTNNRLQLTRQRVNSHVSAESNIQQKLIKHVYELHVKFSFAIVCMVFLFIGASMGSIVRKGGFGYPLLISIVFFILFVLMTIFCKKLAESEALSPILAAWIPVLALAPLAALLTFKAINDSKFIDLSGLLQYFHKWRSTKVES